MLMITLTYDNYSKLEAEPHSPAGSISDMRTGGRWFEYSFGGLMIVIATGFIPLSLLSIVSIVAMWASSHWLGKNTVWSTG